MIPEYHLLPQFPFKVQAVNMVLRMYKGVYSDVYPQYMAARSGYDYHDYGGQHNSYASPSGGGYGHHHHGGDCCPLVVDPMTLCALLGSIALATYFLGNIVIPAEIMPPTPFRAFRHKRRGKTTIH